MVLNASNWVKGDVAKEILVCAIACVPVVWFMYNYLAIPTKIFSIVSFFLLLSFFIMTFVYKRRVTFNLKFNTLSPNVILLLVYLFSIIAIALFSTFNDSVSINLGSLGTSDWIRVVAGLLLGVILPGFGILFLFKHRLDRILLLVLSFLLTISINTTVTFLAFELSFSPLVLMLIANVIVFSLVLRNVFRNRTQAHSLGRLQPIRIELDNEKILLFLLCVFQLSLLISVFILSGLPVPNGDMWDHASFSARLEKNSFLNLDVLSYPPFFAIHLYSISSLTGIPALNISNILGLANIFIVLAFYAFALTLSRKKVIAFLSTFIFTLFSSFTFLVQAIVSGVSDNSTLLANSFLNTTGKTMTVNSIYTFANLNSYAPATLDFISVVVLVALFLKKDKGYLFYLIESFLIMNLLVMHVAETFYVFIFLIAALLLNLTKIKDLVFLTAGIWLGVPVLSITHFNGFSTAVYLAIIYTFLFLFMFFGRKVDLFGKISRKASGLYSRMSKIDFKLFMVFALLFIYAFLIVVWESIYMEANGNLPELLTTFGAAPTYFIPVIFGLSMTLSVFFIAQCLISNSLRSDEAKIIGFLIIAFIIAFLVGKAMTLSNILGYNIYRELRFLATFGGVTFSIISGYALYKWVLHHRFKKYPKQLLTVGLGLLILLGSTSTFLSAVFWADLGMGAYSLDSQEVDALNFLKQRVNPLDVVLAYNTQSEKKVGLTGARPVSRYSIPFSSVSPDLSNAFLQGTDYIYLTKYDYATIQQSDTYMKSLLPMLPIIFNNSEIVIFSVPKTNFYSSTLSVPVVLGSNAVLASPKLALFALLSLPYHVYTKWEAEIFNSSVIILLEDFSNSSDAQKYAVWVQKGGNLIIFGDKPGYYSNLLQIHGNSNPLLANGFAFSQAYVYINSTFNIEPKESFADNVIVTSWYTFNNQKVAPLEFTIAIGDGKLTYIDSDISSETFSSLITNSKSFLESLNPLLFNLTIQQKTKNGFPIQIDGTQTLEGGIDFETSRIDFYGTNAQLSLKLSNGSQISLSPSSLELSSVGVFSISLKGHLTVVPLRDSYVNISVMKGQELDLAFRQDNLIYISSENNLASYNISTAKIKFNTSFNATARSPFFMINGTVILDRVFFDIPFNNAIGRGEGPLTLNGEFFYNILVCDANAGTSFGNRVFFNGSYYYDVPTILQIELPGFITEQTLILIIAAFIFAVFVTFIIRRNNVKKVEKLRF